MFIQLQESRQENRYEKFRVDVEERRAGFFRVQNRGAFFIFTNNDLQKLIQRSWALERVNEHCLPHENQFHKN